MPARGYRKGISDTKQPLPRRIHTRLADTIHAALMADATRRSTTASRIVSALVAAFYTRRRPELPHAATPSQQAVYELARIGNNLNQIARQANLMHLHHIEAEARRAIPAMARFTAHPCWLLAVRS
jgi:hypothetical protein